MDYNKLRHQKTTNISRQVSAWFGGKWDIHVAKKTCRQIYPNSRWGGGVGPTVVYKSRGSTLIIRGVSQGMGTRLNCVTHKAANSCIPVSPW